MSESHPTPTHCRQCQAVVGARRLTITESEAIFSTVSDWTLCSWACARELVIRMIRAGRDER